MKKEKDCSSETAKLRRYAEDRLKAKTALQPPMTMEETQRLVHELEVHQIELEMQNAELLRTRDAVETALARYTDLYDFAPVGYFSIDCDGTICKVNLTGAGLLGVDRTSLIGRSFGQFVAAENRPTFNAFMENVFSAHQENYCEIFLQKKGQESLFVRIKAAPCRSGSECRIAVIDVSDLKKAEDARRDSEARLTAFVDATFEGIVESAAGRIVDCNEQFARMFGYPAAELKGMDIANLIAPEDRDRVIANIRQGLESVQEDRVLRKDGTRFVVETHGRPVSPAGATRHTAVRDITARKQAEEARLLSEANFRTIFNAALDAILIIALDGRFLEINDTICRRLGYSREELLSMTVMDIDPPEFAELVPMRMAELTEKGKLVFESAHLCKDGRRMPVEVSARMISFKGQPAILSVTRDITERKEFEKALLEEKKFTENALNTIKDIFFVIGMDGELIRWNRSLSRVTRFSDAEIAMMKPTDFFPAEEAGQVQDAIEAVFKKGSTVLETVLSTRDGEKNPYEFTGSVIADHDGEIVGICGTGRDISERKNAEKMLLEAKNMLEQRVAERTADLQEAKHWLELSLASKIQLETQLLDAKRLEAIGQLAAGVAHEVRNPLNAILSITEALFREKEIEENPEYEPYIHHIRTQVGRLTRLMNDLLELGKPIPVSSLHPVPLHQLCSDTISLLSTSGLLKNHRLLVISDREPVDTWVLADSAKLQQVLFNVMENAVQHSPQGSDIELRLEKEGLTVPPEGMAMVRITDAGNGVPDDRIDRIFDPFYTTRKGGTGLGLTLVRHIIDHMGGAVELVNNYPSPGCTVVIKIPLAKGGGG